VIFQCVCVCVCVGGGNERYCIYAKERKTNNNDSEGVRAMTSRPSCKVRGKVKPWVVKQHMCSRAGKLSSIWAEF
jgi:hypothetical protein